MNNVNFGNLLPKINLFESNNLSTAYVSSSYTKDDANEYAEKNIDVLIKEHSMLKKHYGDVINSVSADKLAWYTKNKCPHVYRLATMLNDCS